jgi:hypothetical protein
MTIELSHCNRLQEVMIVKTLKTLLFAMVVAMLASGLIAAAPQQTGPPQGYFDIPPGFDFPASKQTLEQYRSTGNLPAQRLHVWKVFAGMTQLSPDGKYPVFETWFSEDETFQTGPTPQGLAPRRVLRRFRQPNQFRTPTGFEPQAAGSALLSFVLYNFAAYNHIRNNRLHRVSQLEGFLQSGTQDPKVPQNRDIPAFPPQAVSLKTVWWPVAKDKVTPMPIWDPDANPAKPGGNDYTTWARVVAVDPTRTDIPPDAAGDISFMGKMFAKSHTVGLSAFYHVVLDQQTASNAMQDPGIRRAAQIALGRGLQAGDYTVLAGTHMTTKEIDDWVWATFWWHDRPSDGPFAADRPDLVKGVWRDYLMSDSFDLNLPREQDGRPHVAFNPWLEARFRDGGNGAGVVSNCMNCHNRASYPGVAFLPIYRGDPDLQKDPAFGVRRLRTDFLWSIPDQSQ